MSNFNIEVSILKDENKQLNTVVDSQKEEIKRLNDLFDWYIKQDNSDNETIYE